MFNPLEVVVRAEQSADTLAIHQVHEAAFPTASEARLVDALRSAGRLTFSLVALHQTKIIGHVAYSPVTLDDYSSLCSGLGIGPIAVVPVYQSQGVGSLLIRESLEAAATAGCTFVVVLGEPAFYTRFGFKPAAQFGLQNEYGAGDEFMVLELKANSLPHPAGRVRYAPEFAAVAP